jgi:hypothetical protein
MGTFRVTVDIDRHATDVFAFVAQPCNMPRWYEAVDRVAEVTPKTANEGGTYEVTRSMPGGAVHNLVDVTESAPNLTVTFESRDGPTPFRYRYRVEPDGDGCHLTLDAEITSAGLPGLLGHLDGVATRAFRQGMQHNLDGLKHLVESTAPQ